MKSKINDSFQKTYTVRHEYTLDTWHAFKNLEYENFQEALLELVLKNLAFV